MEKKNVLKCLEASFILIVIYAIFLLSLPDKPSIYIHDSFNTRNRINKSICFSKVHRKR